jgi:hypothetical protein
MRMCGAAVPAPSPHPPQGCSSRAHPVCGPSRDYTNAHGLVFKATPRLVSNEHHSAHTNTVTNTFTNTFTTAHTNAHTNALTNAYLYASNSFTSSPTPPSLRSLSLQDPA